jgi:pimeloyl-ACP methyl ester carboxylesterase
MMKNVILLHGALGAKVELAGLEQALAHQYKVFSLEFDGHGQTPIKNGFSISDFADTLRDFMQANQLEGADVFGYSMGGYVALYLAAEHPGLIGRIVTLGTKFHWTPEAAAQEVRMLNPDVIEEKVPKFAAYLAKLHGADLWKQNMRNTAQLMLDLGNGELLESRFAAIQSPCFIGLGQRDTMVSLEETQHAVHEIPNAVFFSLDNTEHPLAKVDVRILVEKMDEVLNRTTR